MNSIAHITDCGLPGIKDVPYGIHMCNFYRDGDDLAELLVPYVTAGLRRNERCIWLTADPMNEDEARSELRKGGVDADAEQRKGALIIRRHADWYANADNWIEEEQSALAAGYNGLRVTANVTFSTWEIWSEHMEHEAHVSKVMQGHRILTLCTYHLGKCGASEMFDVVHRHHCAIDQPDSGWRILMRPISPG